MSAEDRTTSRLVARLCIGGLFVVLCFLAGFAILTEHNVASESAHAETAARLSAVYADARYWVGQEESLERKYRLEPTREVLDLHSEAEARLTADLGAVAGIDRSAATRRFIARLSQQHAGYVNASDEMFVAVRKGDERLVIRLDHEVVDPIFGAVQTAVYARSRQAGEVAGAASQRLRQHATSATHAIAVAFALGLLLLAAFAVTWAGTYVPTGPLPDVWTLQRPSSRRSAGSSC